MPLLITHIFFENQFSNLCDSCFDPNPIPMQIGDFMIESKKLNILTEAFFIIFLDKHRPGNDLTMDI